jgi:hypothetical protein
LLAPFHPPSRPARSMPVNEMDSVILLITLARAVATLDADFAAKIAGSARPRGVSHKLRGRGRPGLPPRVRQIFHPVSPTGKVHFARHAAGPQ